MLFHVTIFNFFTFQLFIQKIKDDIYSTKGNAAIITCRHKTAATNIPYLLLCAEIVDKRCNFFILNIPDLLLMMYENVMLIKF